MPIACRMDSDLRLTVTTWSGQVGDAEAIAAYVTLFSNPDWSSGFRELTDLRRADLSKLTTLALATILDITRRVITPEHRLRTAVIASEQMPVSLARMYERLASETPEEIKVFRGKAQALSWLGAPMDLLR